MRRWLGSGLVLVALAGCADPAEPRDPNASAAPAPPVIPQGSGDPGPAREEEGRPAGFADDEAGAVAAATSYLAALHELVGMGEGERRAVVEAMSASGSESLADEAAAGFELLDGMLADARAIDADARLYLRGIPVAYELEAFSPVRARVAVWTLGILVVEGATLVTEVWSTNTVELIRENGDWQLASWERRRGPTPSIATTEPVPPSQLLDAIEGWEGYRYVPEP